MTTLEEIGAFLALKRLALVGASRSGKKFGNTLLRELCARGYEVLPVHPEAVQVDGLACRRRLYDLRGYAEGLLLAVPPRSTEKLVREAASAGIGMVWMQRGSANAEAVMFCRENGISVIEGECILMYLEPLAFPHRVHRWVRRAFGRMPE